MKQKNKILCIITLVLVMFLNLGISVYAVDDLGLIDKKYTDDIYKFSDEKTQISLPFIRSSTNRVIVDRPINKSGIISSKGPIDVTEKLSGIDVLFSSDTVRLNAATEFPVVIADNVVIDSNVSRTTVIIANTVTVTANANISEDLICLAGKLDMLGKINGSLIGRIDITNISGTISQDLRVKTGTLKLYDSARILKNVYIKTSNKDINIADRYPDAKVIYEESETSKTFAQIAQSAIITSIIFALLYIAVDKFSNKKLFEKMLQNSKKHPIAQILSGLLNIILLPIVFSILLILSFSWLYIITIPVIIAYLAFVIITIILSSFIIGSIIYNYLKPKYFSKNNGFWYTFLEAFVVFLILDILCKIPYVGAYISLLIIMLALGVVFISIFKIGDKKTESTDNVDNVSEKNK